VKDGDDVSRFNINMSYQFWHDVQISWLHKLDFYPPQIYLPFMIVVCSLANAPGVGLLYWVGTQVQ